MAIEMSVRRLGCDRVAALGVDVRLSLIELRLLVGCHDASERSEALRHNLMLSSRSHGRRPSL